MNSHLNNAFTTEFEPSVFYLGQNYPNPFRESTKIKFCVAATTRVTLIVYDSEGTEIKKLVDEEKNPGTYEVEFSTYSALDEQSFRLVRNLESGIYFYRLEAGDYRREKEMILKNKRTL